MTRVGSQRHHPSPQKRGCYQCDRLSAYRHRLLSLPDTRGMTQRWLRVSRSVGAVLIVQAGKRHPVTVTSTHRHYTMLLTKDCQS